MIYSKTREDISSWVFLRVYSNILIKKEKMKSDKKYIIGAVFTIVLLLLTTLVPVADESDTLATVHKVSIHYERGSKLISLDEYIVGIMGEYRQWLDMDTYNQEMTRLLALMLRNNILVKMQGRYIIDAEEMPYNYEGINWLMYHYGNDCSEELQYIRDCVAANSGHRCVDKNGQLIEFSWYASSQELKKEGDTGVSLATARQMSREGMKAEEILEYFYPNSTILQDSLD